MTLIESEKLVQRMLMIVLSALSIGFWIFYYSNGFTLSYNDARSHLNVSRRVVDSLQPGLAQIGSVWLPLQHVLQLPLIWIWPLYQTGLAGSVVSMLAFVGGGLLMYRLGRNLELSIAGSVVASLVFAVNQNMLFLQTTPMTEPLMVFTLLLSTYYFAKWTKDGRTDTLVLCGLGTFLATLTRYDGWFFLGTTAGMIGLVALVSHGRKKSESSLIVYLSIASLGILLWMLWNKLIFGEWLYFINGPFSAKAQQDILYREGRLLTRGSWFMSVKTYLWSMWFNLGFATLVLGLFGLFKSAFSNTGWRRLAVVAVMFSPIVFNIVSLYFGQSVIHLPNIPPNTWFNVRYGLMALPVAALGVGMLVDRKIIAAILACVVIAVQAGYTLKINEIITIQDGVRGSSGYFLDDIGEWVHANADDGKILVAASSHDALLFISGLPLKNFITEGMREYWEPALRDPRPSVKYVVMHDGDLVFKSLNNNPNFTEHYQLVYEGRFSDVYKRKD